MMPVPRQVTNWSNSSHSMSPSYAPRLGLLLSPILQYTSLNPYRTPRSHLHSPVLQVSPNQASFVPYSPFLPSATPFTNHNVPSRRNPSRYPEALHRRLGRLDHGVLLRHPLRGLYTEATAPELRGASAGTGAAIPAVVESDDYDDQLQAHHPQHHPRPLQQRSRSLRRRRRRHSLRTVPQRTGRLYMVQQQGR